MYDTIEIELSIFYRAIHILFQFKNIPARTKAHEPTSYPVHHGIHSQPDKWADDCCTGNDL